MRRVQKPSGSDVAASSKAREERPPTSSDPPNGILAAIAGLFQAVSDRVSGAKFGGRSFFHEPLKLLILLLGFVIIAMIYVPQFEFSAHGTARIDVRR